MATQTQKAEIEGLSVVALGSFNPAIFQPFWFSGSDLIRSEEAEEAKIELLQQEVSSFSTEWFSLQVLNGRFAIETADPTKSRSLRDLVLGTFRILEHTPVHAFGFNKNQHFRMQTEDERHAFGNHFAPKKSWGDLLTRPGMRSLTIQGTREDCDADRLQIRIEPSPQVHPGVCIHVNQHYQLDHYDKESPRDHLAVFLKTLQDPSWGDFVSYCDRVSQYLLTQYKAARSD